MFILIGAFIFIGAVFIGCVIYKIYNLDKINSNNSIQKSNRIKITDWKHNRAPGDNLYWFYWLNN